MELKTELQEMFSYSFIPIIIIFIILVCLIIFTILFIKKTKKQNIIIKQIIPKKDINIIKNDYLSRINNLLNDINNKKVSNRKAYQQLSVLIRNFIYEATGIKVQNYSLEEIKITSIPYLYDLIYEFYDPEFNKISTSSIKDSINKTVSVIQKWK